MPRPFAGDRGGAGASVRLQYIAVDLYLALAQLAEIGHRPQAAADQPLNFDRPAVHLPALVPRLARGGGPGQHAVFSGEPTAAGADQKWRHRRFDGAGAENGRPPELDEDAAGGLAGVGVRERQGAQFVGAAVGSGHRVIQRNGGGSAQQPRQERRLRVQPIPGLLEN